MADVNYNILNDPQYQLSPESTSVPTERTPPKPTKERGWLTKLFGLSDEDLKSREMFLENLNRYSSLSKYRIPEEEKINRVKEELRHGKPIRGRDLFRSILDNQVTVADDGKVYPNIIKNGKIVRGTQPLAQIPAGKIPFNSKTGDWELPPLVQTKNKASEFLKKQGVNKDVSEAIGQALPTIATFNPPAAQVINPILGFTGASEYLNEPLTNEEFYSRAREDADTAGSFLSGLLKQIPYSPAEQMKEKIKGIAGLGREHPAYMQKPVSKQEQSGRGIAEMAQSLAMMMGLGAAGGAALGPLAGGMLSTVPSLVDIASEASEGNITPTAAAIEGGLLVPTFALASKYGSAIAGQFLKEVGAGNKIFPAVVKNLAKDVALNTAAGIPISITGELAANQGQIDDWGGVAGRVFGNVAMMTALPLVMRAMRIPNDVKIGKNIYETRIAQVTRYFNTNPDVPVEDLAARLIKDAPHIPFDQELLTQYGNDLRAIQKGTKPMPTAEGQPATTIAQQSVREAGGATPRKPDLKKWEKPLPDKETIDPMERADFNDNVGSAVSAETLNKDKGSKEFYNAMKEVFNPGEKTFGGKKADDWTNPETVDYILRAAEDTGFQVEPGKTTGADVVKHLKDQHNTPLPGTANIEMLANKDIKMPEAERNMRQYLAAREGTAFFDGVKESLLKSHDELETLDIMKKAFGGSGNSLDELTAVQGKKHFGMGKISSPRILIERNLPETYEKLYPGQTMPEIDLSPIRTVKGGQPSPPRFQTGEVNVTGEKPIEPKAEMPPSEAATPETQKITPEKVETIKSMIDDEMAAQDTRMKEVEHIDDDIQAKNNLKADGEPEYAIEDYGVAEGMKTFTRAKEKAMEREIAEAENELMPLKTVETPAPSPPVFQTGEVNVEALPATTKSQQKNLKRYNELKAKSETGSKWLKDAGSYDKFTKEQKEFVKLDKKLREEGLLPPEIIKEIKSQSYNLPGASQLGVNGALIVAGMALPDDEDGGYNEFKKALTVLGMAGMMAYGSNRFGLINGLKKRFPFFSPSNETIRGRVTNSIEFTKRLADGKARIPIIFEEQIKGMTPEEGQIFIKNKGDELYESQANELIQQYKQNDKFVFGTPANVARRTGTTPNELRKLVLENSRRKLAGKPTKPFATEYMPEDFNVIFNTNTPMGKVVDAINNAQIEVGLAKNQAEGIYDGYKRKLKDISQAGMSANEAEATIYRTNVLLKRDITEVKMREKSMSPLDFINNMEYLTSPMGVRDYILKANNEFVKSGEATPMRTETADYLVADLWGHYRGAQDIMTEKQVLGPIYNKYGIRPRDFYEEYTTTKLTHDELQRQTDELADRIKGVRKDIRNIKKDETTGRISTEDAQAARENATRATEELKMVAMAHKTDPVNIELKRKFNEMTKAMEFIDNSRRLWGVSEVLPERYNKDGSIKRWGTVLYQVVPEFNEAGDITGYTKVKYADSKAKAVIHSDTKQRSTRDWLEWKDRYHIEESKEHPGYWWMDEIDAHGNTVLDAETGLRKQVLVEKREFDGWKDRNGRQSRLSIAEKAIRDYLEQGDYSNTNTDKLLNDLNTQRKVLLKDEDLGDIDFIPIPEEFGEIPSYIEKLKNNRLTAKDAAEFFGRVLKGVHSKQLRFDLPSYNFNHGGNILAETPMKQSLKQYRNSVNLSIERIANAIGMGRVLSTASEESLALGLKGMGETNVARYTNGLVKDLTYTPTNLNVFNTGRFRVGDFEFKPGKVVDIAMALPSTAVMAFNVKSAINNLIYGLRTFSYADIQAGRFWRHYADIPNDFVEGLVRNTGKIIKNIGDYEGGLAKYGREVEQRANELRNDPIREMAWKKMEKAEMLEGFFEDIQNKTAFDKYQYHSLSFQRFTENLLRQRMAQRGLNAFMDLYPFAKSGLTPEAYSDLALSQIRTNLWENAGYVSPMELPATLRKMAKNPYMNATLRLIKYAAEDITNSLTRITMALKGNVYGEGRSKYLAQLASMAFVGTVFGGLKSVPGYQDAVSFLNYMSSSASKMDEDNPPPILSKPMVRALWDYGYKTIAEPLGISRGQWEDTRNILEEGFLATITGIPINATPLRFGDIYNPAGVSIWFQAVAKGGKSTEGLLGALTTILYYSVFPKGGRLAENAFRQLAAGEHLYPMEKGGGIIEGHGKFGIKDFVRALISTNNIEGDIESNRKFMEGRLAMSSPVQKRDFLKGAIGSYTTLDTRMTGAKDKIVYKTDFWKHVPEMTDRYFEYVGRHREEISEANDILDEYMSMHEAELRQLANKNVTGEIPASWNESKEKDLKQQLKQYLSDFYVKMATRDALISTYEKHKTEFAKDKKNDILMLINKDNLGEPDDKVDQMSMTIAGTNMADKGPKKAFAYALSKLAGKQKQFDKLK